MSNEINTLSTALSIFCSSTVMVMAALTVIEEIYSLYLNKKFIDMITRLRRFNSYITGSRGIDALEDQEREKLISEMIKLSDRSWDRFKDELIDFEWDSHRLEKIESTVIKDVEMLRAMK